MRHAARSSGALDALEQGGRLQPITVESDEEIAQERAEAFARDDPEVVAIVGDLLPRLVVPGGADDAARRRVVAGNDRGCRRGRDRRKNRDGFLVRATGRQRLERGQAPIGQCGLHHARRCGVDDDQQNLHEAGTIHEPCHGMAPLSWQSYTWRDAGGFRWGREQIEIGGAMRTAIVTNVSQRFRACAARRRVGAATVAATLACAASLLAQQEDVLPRPPLSLTASVSNSTVALQWVRNPAGMAAESFQIHAGSVAGASNIAVITLPAGVTTLSANAPPGRYFVRVIAVNRFGASPSVE